MEQHILLSTICLGVALVDGMTYSSPIILSKIKETYDISSYENIILSLFTGSLFMSCLVFQALYKLKITTIFRLAVLMVSCSFVLAALTYHPLMLLISRGIFYGLSSGLLFYSGLMIALLEFDKPALVTGIYTTMSSIGAIIVPILVTISLTYVSWKVTLLVVAIMFILIFFIPLTTEESESIIVVKGKYSLFGVIFLGIFNFVSHITFFIPYFYVFESIKETNPTLAPYYISYLGLCQVPGRLFQGIIIENKWVSALYLNVVACFFIVLGFIGLTLSTFSTDGISLVLIMISSLLLALGLSVVSCSIGLTVKQIASGDKISPIMTTLSVLRGLGVMSSTFFGGMISSNIVVILLVGLVAGVISLIFVLIPAIKFKDNYLVTSTDDIDDDDQYSLNVLDPDINTVCNLSKYSMANDRTKVSV